MFLVTDYRAGIADGVISPATSILCSYILSGFYPSRDSIDSHVKPSYLEHSPRAFEHYFSGQGTPITYSQADICELISSSDYNIDHLMYNLTQAMQYSEQIAVENQSVYLTSNSDAGLKTTCFDDKGHNCNLINGGIPNKHGITSEYCNAVHVDWQVTVGESFGAIRGYVEKNGDTYILHYRYYMSDIYEWTNEGKLDIGTVLHFFHEIKWAKQFLINGYFEGTITWTEGQSATDWNVYNQLMDEMCEIEGDSRWNQSSRFYDYYRGNNISYRDTI